MFWPVKSPWRRSTKSLKAVAGTAGKYWHDRKRGFFAFISVAWLAVVGFGLLLFWAEPASDNSHSRWLYLLTGLPEPIFIGLAVLFWLTEEPRTVKERHSNPDFDPRKLY
jgi:hypothetical protein